jgi:hypothetical protein
MLPKLVKFFVALTETLIHISKDREDKAEIAFSVEF